MNRVRAAPRVEPGMRAAASVVAFLSGTRRGEERVLEGQVIRIGTDDDVELWLSSDTASDPRPHHATLIRHGSTYELRAEPHQGVWVNGENADARVLASGDVIEVGPGGNVLRFRIYPPSAKPRRSAAEVFSDCVECAARGADDVFGRVRRLATELPRDMVSQTSAAFRVGLALSLLAVAGTTSTLASRSRALEERLVEVTGLAELLASTEADELSRAELLEAVDELERGIVAATERVSAIEGRAGGVGAIVREATSATVFLQGAYGFRDPQDGRLVRLVLDSSHRPLIGPRGEPRVTTDGAGPVLEASYTGTGFAVSEEGLMLTNRHVALPWETAAPARSLLALGFEPFLTRFLAFIPGRTEPLHVRTVRASETADIALLCCIPASENRHFLRLAAEPPQPGDEVVVLGYPLGLRALIARADADLVDELRRGSGTDPWDVARLLSERGYIAPLATRGIVGQLTGRFVVYDAETTSGGSGGPVLGLDGRVVAVNTAILPEFGGSNLGIPAEAATAFLQTVRKSPTHRD